MDIRVRNNNVKRYVLIGVLTCLHILAYTKTVDLQGKLNENTNFLAPIILLFLVPYLLNQFFEMKDKRNITISIIGGLLFSFCYVVGMYLHYNNCLPKTVGEAIFLSLLVLAIAVVCIPVMSIILKNFRKMSIWYEIKQREQKLKYKTTWVILISWMIIFICWLPTFLTNWPGNFIFDAKYQIQEVLNQSYHTHHPLIHTYIMGAFYRIGVSIGNVSLGFSFYTLLQMLILSFAGSAVIGYFYKKNTPKIICISYLLFYAIVPVHAIFSVTATKDVLFAAFFLLFMIGIFSWVVDHKEFTYYQWIGFILSGILMTLFRNNAIFALLVIAPFFILFSIGKERKRKILLSMISIVGGFLLSSFLLGVLLNAYSSDSLKESFSVPIQQIARVASYRSEDISQELYVEIVEYIPEDKIALYNPYISDPIKNELDEVYLRENVAGFLSLWLKVGMQYPEEYVASFMANTMGFWYPGETEYAVCEEIASFHTLIGTENEIIKYNYGDIFAPINSFLFADMNYREIPILRHFFKPVLYFWIMLLAIMNAIYAKKGRNVLAMGLLITYFLSVFLGPFSTLRYVYCIVVCLPFMVGAIFETRN